MSIQNTSKAGFHVEAYADGQWRSYPLDSQTPPSAIPRLVHALDRAQQAARQNRIRTRVVSAARGVVMAEFDANGARVVTPTRESRAWERRRHYRDGKRR